MRICMLELLIQLMSSHWGLRFWLVVFFAVVGLLMVEKEKSNLVLGSRRSHFTSGSTAELSYPHVGKLSDFRLQQKHQERSSPLQWLNFDKKVNTFVFTFYNWYYFELEFVDLTYDSYVQFKVFVDDQLHDRWTERVGFRLDQSFYPKGGYIRGNKNCSKCKSSPAKGMNIDIVNHVFNLSVRQETIKNMSSQVHDGYKYGRFWFYTPNRTLDDPANEIFRDDLTVTTFNLTFKGPNQKMQANLTHVLRHNQCFSYLDEENTGTFKHNCVGGYGGGRIFLDRKIAHKELQTFDKTVKSAYNLDFNRTKTAFIGVRSTNSLNKKLGNTLPRTNWRWKGFRAFMQCFSKPEYYEKRECIEKERYVGLHFGRALGDLAVENFQDYLFYNGKIVLVHKMDYTVDERYKKNQNITFKSVPSEDLWQPEFEINFTVLSKDRYEDSDWLGRRNELRAYGFWSGYIDEGVKGEKVDFFNITGYIETTNSIY